MAAGILQVVCNTVTLAMDHYGISDVMSGPLDKLNVAFSSIFLVEMVVKIIGA